MIRAIEEEDLEIVEKLHAKYFATEFELPNFRSDFHCVFTITDDSGSPIVIGGVRPIAEVVILTDKGRHVRDKVKALREMLKASLYTAARFNHKQIHCAITDPAYERHLKKHGFRNTKGNFLVRDV